MPLLINLSQLDIPVLQEPLLKTVHNCVKFILFADAELAKAIPSLPTMISMMSVTPLEAQSFFSLLLMAREALVLSLIHI